MPKLAASQGTKRVGVPPPPPDAGAGANDPGFAFFDTLEDLFENGTADGVILATPTLLHVAQATLCIGRACPVLVEKPIASTVAQAAPLVALAAARGVCHGRGDPDISQDRHAGDDRPVAGPCVTA